MLKSHLLAEAMKADVSLTGVSGTVTSLAFIDMELNLYDPEKIGGYPLSLKKVQQYISRLGSISSDKLRKKYPEVMEGRADIFLAGLLILKGVMQVYGFKEVTVSTGGIRHGALLADSF